MFTSVRNTDAGTAFAYLTAAIAAAVFGMIYEHFSFGVWSNYMVYAFLVPLAGGAFPYLLRYLSKMPETDTQMSIQEHAADDAAVSEKSSVRARGLHLAAVATLTTGSMIRGVLDIYGTTNRLLMIYLAAGLLLAAAAVVMGIAEGEKKERDPVNLFDYSQHHYRNDADQDPGCYAAEEQHRKVKE